MLSYWKGVAHTGAREVHSDCYKNVKPVDAWLARQDPVRPCMMTQNLGVTTMGSISPVGPATLSAGQGATPISAGLHPIQPEWLGNLHSGNKRLRLTWHWQPDSASHVSESLRRH
jgi:hypothetical protein